MTVRVQPSLQQVQPNPSFAVDTYVIVVVLYGLSCKVEYGPRYNALTDEVADFKVCGEDGLRVFVLNTNQTGFSCLSKIRSKYSLL